MCWKFLLGVALKELHYLGIHGDDTEPIGLLVYWKFLLGVALKELQQLGIHGDDTEPIGWIVT